MDTIKKIGVVGMGYVGIPSALLFANSSEYNFVYGFQRKSLTSGYKIDMLNKGESPLKGEEPGLKDLLKRTLELNKFECTSDFSNISEMDAVTISIQTPFLNKNDLLPDFSALMSGVSDVGKFLRPGMLVVIESTVTPGTTTTIVKNILEQQSGLIAGKDFYLAHAPERVMVGRLLRNIREHDRVVGGIDDASTKRATELYSPVLTTGKIIPMTATAAEITKTAENAFRDLQIAAVNELALYCEGMGVNVYDVRDGIASLKEEGVTRAILYPGAGVGGHCLTKDTYHLERGVQILKKGFFDYPKGEPSLYTVARNINDFMPKHMFNLTVNALKEANKPVFRLKIALLGWSFIANSDDDRNTPSEVYRDLFLKEEMKIVVHDPYVVKEGIKNNLEEVLKGADIITIFTNHNEYKNLSPVNIKMLSGRNKPIIIDGRNVIDPDVFIKHGFIYKGIGRGDKN